MANKGIFEGNEKTPHWKGAMGHGTLQLERRLIHALLGEVVVFYCQQVKMLQ